MKIVCVSGGSYKSFYLNHFAKLKHCDLLIFNYGIIYDCVDAKNCKLVTKELCQLSSELGAIVAAGVNLVVNGKSTKSLVICNGQKTYFSSLDLGVKICLNNHFKNTTTSSTFVLGGQKTNYHNLHKIILSDKPIKVNTKHCSFRKIYIFCSKHGVIVVKNKRITRNIYKVCILNL